MPTGMASIDCIKCVVEEETGAAISTLMIMERVPDIVPVLVVTRNYFRKIMSFKGK